ncbi:pilus assembly FimT family protein [Poriferisphaera sp. WC338]|uniref:pilus assembly FimT family protein n=1 Tax=Poriferisphaera sp. WC338 TaxID=3425129 RepID=UPI003D813BDA
MHHKLHGYTLIEVLVVVAIIGIAGSVIVPAMLRAGSLGVQAASRIIISDLLYAQNDAIAKQRKRTVKFSVFGDSYELLDENDDVLDVSWKGGSTKNYKIDFQNDSRFEGVNITKVDFDTEVEVSFDELGSPSSAGVIELEFESEKYQINIAPFTGKVTIKRL